MDKAYAAVIDAVETGRISQADLDAKVRRVLELKVKRGIVADPMVDPAALGSVVGTAEHLATADADHQPHEHPRANERRQGAPDGDAGQEGPRHRLRRDDDPDPRRRASAKAGATTTVNQTGTSPTDAQIASAVASAQGKDAVVVTTMKAWDTNVTDKRGGQQKLVKALQDTGIPVIVVATRDPYDIAYLPGTATYLSTYSYSPVAIEAAARVITGAVAPTGKLPVDIPAKGAPGHGAVPLRPRPHLLSWRTDP